MGLLFFPALFLILYLIYLIVTLPEYFRKANRIMNRRCGECRAYVRGKEDKIILKNPLFGEVLYGCKACEAPLYECEGMRCKNYAIPPDSDALFNNSYCPECELEHQEKENLRLEKDKKRMRKEIERDRLIGEKRRIDLVLNQKPGKCPYCGKIIQKPVLIDEGFLRATFECPMCHNKVLKCIGTSCEDYAKTRFFKDDFFCEKCSFI
jgi:hypothetical protein